MPHVPRQHKKTARQLAVYRAAFHQLEETIQLFVDTVEKQGYYVRLVAWNSRKVFRTNGTKRNLSVTTFGGDGQVPVD